MIFFFFFLFYLFLYFSFLILAERCWPSRAFLRSLWSRGNPALDYPRLSYPILSLHYRLHYLNHHPRNRQNVWSSRHQIPISSRRRALCRHKLSWRKSRASSSFSCPELFTPLSAIFIFIGPFQCVQCVCLSITKEFYNDFAAADLACRFVWLSLLLAQHVAPQWPTLSTQSLPTSLVALASSLCVTLIIPNS